jgi:serine/threonine protein kinase
MGIAEKDIDPAITNEVRVLNKIRENGGHPNIITVLWHGWMATGHFYALDMDLCEMNLGNFIDGGYITALGPQYFEMGGEGDLLDCLTMWTIMRHVTSGLEHIHSLREVHRDLKPHNGISCRPWLI